MSKTRLDNLLVTLNLCESRQKAQRLIRAGEVKVDRRIIDKPGTEVSEDAEIELQKKLAYVSRGGYKLQKALETFPIEVVGRICLDGGISTGGFTDCLLQSGARRVYGVDVGYGQVAWTIRQDSRVILKERTNFRHLTPLALYNRAEPEADLGVMDLSFISLTKILEPLWQLLKSPREVILLIKPQFEVGREKVGKKGVVRDNQDRASAIAKVIEAATNLGWYYQDVTWSPLKGPAGNVEYLLWLKEDRYNSAPSLAILESIVGQSSVFLA